MRTNPMSDKHGYIFADEHDHSAERFRVLSELYDASTSRYIERLGITRGCTCLEIGAGGGSIARWLAPLVSPGRVVATDRAMPAFDVSGVANLNSSSMTSPPSHFPLRRSISSMRASC